MFIFQKCNLYLVCNASFHNSFRCIIASLLIHLTPYTMKVSALLVMSYSYLFNSALMFIRITLHYFSWCITECRSCIANSVCSWPQSESGAAAPRDPGGPSGPVSTNQSPVSRSHDESRPITAQYPGSRPISAKLATH